VPDPDASRPRLVSVGEEPEKPAESPAAEGSEAASGRTSKRVLWLLAVLSIAVLAGLVAQTLRVQSLQQENEELTGELFATRSALDAYAARFAEVRQSVDALLVQFEKLDALVNSDPLTPPPETPTESEPTADLGDRP
jgi:uncharacterized protein HemX